MFSRLEEQVPWKITFVPHVRLEEHIPWRITTRLLGGRTATLPKELSEWGINHCAESQHVIRGSATISDPNIV